MLSISIAHEHSYLHGTFSTHSTVLYPYCIIARFVELFVELCACARNTYINIPIIKLYIAACSVLHMPQCNITPTGGGKEETPMWDVGTTPFSCNQNAESQLIATPQQTPRLQRVCGTVLFIKLDDKDRRAQCPRE